MKYKTKNIVLIIVGIFITYTFASIVFTINTGYSVEFGNYEKYKWLFKDKYQKQIDTIFYVEDYRKSDSYSKYNIEQYIIGIHEISDFRQMTLSYIDFEYNLNLEDVNFYPAQILNENSNYRPTIRAYWKLPFNNSLNVSFNERTQIDSIIKGDNFICYHAKIDKMLFSNEENKQLMFFDFSKKSKNTILIFLKKRNRFFVIMVNSREDFGMEALDVFDI